MSFKPLFAAAAVAALAGCQTVPPLGQAGSLDAGFGETFKYDMAIQVIDPDPVYTAEDAQPGDHGEKGANAVKRYRTDQVKETERQTTGGVTGLGAGTGSGPR